MINRPDLTLSERPAPLSPLAVVAQAPMPEDYDAALPVGRFTYRRAAPGSR